MSGNQRNGGTVGARIASEKSQLHQRIALHQQSRQGRQVGVGVGNQGLPAKHRIYRKMSSDGEEFDDNSREDDQMQNCEEEVRSAMAGSSSCISGHHDIQSNDS